MKRLRSPAAGHLLRPLLLLVLAFILLAGSASAQTKRILLVGDSWVDQAFVAGAFQTALANKGLSQFDVDGDTTAIGGTLAAQWATTPFLDLITAEMSGNPSIDIFHLSMGGNDFLGAPPGTDLLVLANEILANQQIVVDHILALRPDAKITINTYDYTPANNNVAQSGLAQLSINQTNLTFGYFTLNQLGVLHNVFGVTGQFAPGTTSLPGNWGEVYLPLAGGDLNVAGDSAVFTDGIHPTTAGYVALAEHAIDSYYEAWLLGAPMVPVLGPHALVALVAALGVGGHWMSRKRAA